MVETLKFIANGMQTGQHASTDLQSLQCHSCFFCLPRSLQQAEHTHTAGPNTSQIDNYRATRRVSEQSAPHHVPLATEMLLVSLHPCRTAGMTPNGAAPPSRHHQRCTESRRKAKFMPAELSCWGEVVGQGCRIQFSSPKHYFAFPVSGALYNRSP